MLTHTIKKVWTVCERLIVGFLIAVFIVVASPLLPFKHIPRTYIVTTGSMEPTIPTGSIIVSRPVDTNTLDKGTIIAFTSPKNPKDIILHRIYSKKSGSPIVFETKGDNNNAPDNWEVPDSSVVGVYVYAIPFLGHPAAYMRTPLGFGLMIVLPSLLIIIMQIRNIKKGINEEVEKCLAKKLKEKETNSLLIGWLMIMIPLGVLFLAKHIQAQFFDSIPISDVTLSVKDFVPPTAPTNLHWNNPDISCGGTTRSMTITADWDDAFDAGGSGIDHYEYNITYPKLGGSTGNSTISVIPSQYSGVFNQDNGVHTYKVRAYDHEGNVSEWSNTCAITYEGTPIVLSMTMGYETAETGPLPDVGVCPIVTKDLSQNGGTASLQTLKWTTIPFATSYRITGYKKNGSAWDPYGSPYILTPTQYTISGTIATYTSWATAQITTAYFIEALDSANKVLGTTQPETTGFTCTFTVDRTAPSTAISISNSPARTITQQVRNSSFEDVDGSGKPRDWIAEGDVEVVGSDHGVSPHDGSHMVKIGRDTDPGNIYALNSISQPIPNTTKNISFWYNFHTYDSFGYDEPGFVVFLNDRMVYHLWARDIASGANPDASGWRQFLFDLSSIPQGEEPILTIVFYAGNTEILETDTPEKQSWVYIDTVSTEDVVVNSSATFTLTPSDNFSTARSWYQIGTDGTPTLGTSFTLSARPTGDVISYWSIDTAGNEETHKTLRVIYDNEKPSSITDLSAYQYENGAYELNFTAVDPNDAVTGNDTATSYDIRYATTPITTDGEFYAATATTSASPRPKGQQETVRIHGLDSDTQYWFAVKAKDAAPNWSVLGTGSIATVVLHPEPELNGIVSDDKKYLTIIVEHISGITSIAYEVTYDHDGTVQGFMGSLPTDTDPTQTTQDMATCTTGGTCVFHTDATNIHIKATLTKSDSTTLILEKTL